jgi:uncharacterized protein YgiM (DUF1202 family)
MDKDKKSTLEELMKTEDMEAVKADDKADAISLDEPKKRTWLVILITVPLTLLIAAVGYVAWQSYTADKTLKAEDKVDTIVTPKTETTEETPTLTTGEKSIYIDAPEGLNFRKESKSDAEILAIIPNGTKLILLETSGDWYKVEYDSELGWIAKLYTSETNPLVYKNTTYGFEVTFPAAWAYKFFPTQAQDGVTAGYYVAVPTADTAIDETSMGIEKGYNSLIALSIYTPSQWDTISALEGPKPTLAVQNTKYVVAYSLPNGVPGSDLAARVAEVKSVLATIKFF